MKKVPVILGIIFVFALLAFVLVSGVLNVMGAVSALKAMGYGNSAVTGIILLCILSAVLFMGFIILWMKKKAGEVSGGSQGSGVFKKKRRGE